MPKSITRVKIEQAFTDANVKLTSTAYTDKSKSGWRIKFCFLELSEKKMKKVRKNLRKIFPENDVRLFDVEKAHHYGFWGVAVKVFN